MGAWQRRDRGVHGTSQTHLMQLSGSLTQSVLQANLSHAIQPTLDKRDRERQSHNGITRSCYFTTFADVPADSLGGVRAKPLSSPQEPRWRRNTTAKNDNSLNIFRLYFDLRVRLTRKSGDDHTMWAGLRRRGLLLGNVNGRFELVHEVRHGHPTA